MFSEASEPDCLGGFLTHGAFHSPGYVALTGGSGVCCRLLDCPVLYLYPFALITRIPHSAQPCPLPAERSRPLRGSNPAVSHDPLENLSFVQRRLQGH
jgi:hypothetical protein